MSIDQTLHAKIQSPPNDQRLDPKWNWEGIIINGNSQCQGNANEDLLKGIGLEFGIKGLSDINTYNYYAMFFGYLQTKAGDEVDRTDFMIYLNHAAFLNFIFKANSIPVRAVPYSSIGDKGAVKFNGSCDEIYDFLSITKRQISLGTTLTGSTGHWIRIDEGNAVQKWLGGNDSFGTFPYKTIAEKNVVRVRYSYESLKNKIRRAIILEDL